MLTTPVRCLPILLLLSLPLVAQGADTVCTACGVWQHDGETRAGGPDYAARFDGRGIEYLPLLGRAAEPVHFQLAAVRRGAVDVWTRGDALVVPAIDGHRVCYRHDGLTEVYEARVEGIEQSFVFRERPAGCGDLVVCGRITTDLPLHAASDEGVRYEREGSGGVTFGAVTGVDANGASARGSIRACADHVEWVLPAAFVDRAAYPLVLDPLIGSAFAVGSGTLSTGIVPSVAYDATNARYLVVWNVPVTGDDEIRAMAVSAAGVPSNALLGLGYGTLTRQAVANINGTNRFVVVFTTTTTVGSFTSTAVKALAVDADLGPASISTAAPVATGSSLTASVGHAVVGGDSRPFSTAQTALVVFTRGSDVMARIVHVPPTGEPIATGTSANQLESGGANTQSVTTHGGSSLRWLVTWRAKPGPQSIRGGVVGSSGTLCAPSTTFFTAASGDMVDAPVSASPDGTTFLVAWHGSLGGAEDVQCRLATWSGACGTGSLALGPLATASTDPGLQDSPAVAFAKDKFLLAWRHRTTPSATPGVVVKSIDATTCAACGTEWSADSAVLAIADPAIASRYSAGDTTNDEALVVWSNGTIRGRRCEARGTGTVASLGGSCGNLGPNNLNTYTGTPVIGSADFELRLDSPTLPVLALVIGLSNVSVPCGPCTLVPAFDATVAGSATVPLPLPCDVAWLGVEFYTQWLLFAPGGCPLFPDYALSNALKFTVGE